MTQQPPTATLSHHRLGVYQYARRLATLVHREPPRNRELRSQAQRAAISTALNVAEGAALNGCAKKRHDGIARSSALEVVAAYEIAHDGGVRAAR